MNQDGPKGVLLGLRETVSTMADFLARLSFWRFVGLCVLLMMAASVAESLFPEHRKHSSTIVIKKDKIPAETPGTNKQIEPDQTADKDKGKGVEIRIDEAGIVVRGSKDLERLGKKIEERIDRENIDTEDGEIIQSVPLPQIAVLMIMLMLIVRLVSKSKLQAEAQTAVARDQAEREALSRQLAEARLQALQAQVEPHFLFNTLAAVEYLIETDPPRAAQMQRNLIGYLRSVMPNFRKPDSTLGREVDICRHYLEILKMRMEDRLQVTIDVPTHLESAALPPLMLQSIVENAIRHGLEPKPEGGQLHLRADVSEGRLAITVVDTGVGFSSHGAPASSGVGLANIRERLAALFGDRGRLMISPNLPHGSQVRLELPYAPGGSK
jgi:signal transduction histidine kinase